MGILNTNTLKRDLCIMVRKGSFQFEPSDRIPMNLPAGTFYVGGVARDELTGILTYSLYDSEGRFIPSSKGLRELDTLSPSELHGLRDMVSVYYERSINRFANIVSIVDSLSADENHTFKFSDGLCPSVLITNGFGSMKEFTVGEVWNDGSDLFCSCRVNGGEVNLPLLRIDDRGISNIRSCIKSQASLHLKPKEKEMSAPKVSL